MAAIMKLRPSVNDSVGDLSLLVCLSCDDLTSHYEMRDEDVHEHEPDYDDDDDDDDVFASADMCSADGTVQYIAVSIRRRVLRLKRRIARIWAVSR